MAQEHSHDHAYLHEHNIPHLHHETDVHDADHNHEHAHSHDHTEGHGHVHENTQAVLNRLSRAIGHLESVRKMVENGRDCSEVLIQIAAVRAAITNIGKVILQDHIQQLLQLVGAVHPQAGQQRTAAADGHDDIGKQLPGVRQHLPCTDDIHCIHHPGKQENGTHDGAEGGNILVPLLGAFLLLGGHIRTVDWLLLPGGGRLWWGISIPRAASCSSFCTFWSMPFRINNSTPNGPDIAITIKMAMVGILAK